MESLQLILNESRPEIKSKAIRILSKIKQNLVRHPENPDFRRIRIATLLSKIECPAVLGILSESGFVYSEDGECLILRDPEHFDPNKIDSLVELDMSPEEREHRRLVEENRQKIASERKEALENKRALMRKIEQAKRDRSESLSAKGSAPQDLDFGRKDVDLKFHRKPDPGAGGGGLPMMGGG